MSNETTTVNGDEIDPETGEVLQQHNVRPEQPITNPEELTAFLKRVRAIEHDADDHKRVKAAEEAARKKLSARKSTSRKSSSARKPNSRANSRKASVTKPAKAKSKKTQAGKSKKRSKK